MPYAAERLAKSATGPAAFETTLACVVPTLAHPLYGDLLGGIEQEARAAGLHLITGQSENDP